MRNIPRLGWLMACAIASILTLSTGPAKANDGVAEYEELYRRMREGEIGTGEFDRRAKELIEQYDLNVSPYTAHIIPPSKASTINGTPYLIVVGLNGAPMMAVLGIFASEAECTSFINDQVLAPLRQVVRSRNRVWFADDDTAIEWVPERLGGGHWQVDIYRCGPHIAGRPDLTYQKMGLDFPAIVDDAVQQIRARGFDPG